MHVKTRRNTLVEILCALGLSVSYDSVLRLSSHLANAVCVRYEENGTACPPNLRGQVFTTCCHGQHRPRPLVHNSNRMFKSMAQVFLSFNIQVPLRKAMIWGKLSCGNRRLKSASVLCLRATRTSQLLCRRAASLYCKPSLRVQLMVRNQSTITDAISKEVEWLEDINKI